MTTFLNLAENQTLISIPNPTELPLILELLKSNRPKVIMEGGSYLVAEDEKQARACRRAIIAADEYARVDLSIDTKLAEYLREEDKSRVSEILGDTTAHAIKLKIAKAKASKFAELILQSFGNWQTVERNIYKLQGIDDHIRLYSEGFSGDPLTIGWGNYDKFKASSYIGELAFQIKSKHEPYPITWIRLPENDAFLLEHNFLVHNAYLNKNTVSEHLQHLGITGSVAEVWK
jgi:hypothetical protein